jgi:polar amino acid transport system ATP-binding protein/putative ABC transport system ATP-binding protein
MISFENIFLKFENESVFSNFSMEILKGEKTGISGPSGSGKSSILKMIMGITIPDSGRISVNDMEVSPASIKEIRKLIAWIPQNINLPVDNAAELLKLLNIEKENQDKFFDYLYKTGISPEMAEKRFSEVSTGQKQRIVIAASLTLESRILLIDEPTSALDSMAAEKLATLILSKDDITVVSASHDPVWNNSLQRIIKLEQ